MKSTRDVSFYVPATLVGNALSGVVWMVVGANTALMGSIAFGALCAVVGSALVAGSMSKKLPLLQVSAVVHLLTSLALLVSANLTSPEGVSTYSGSAYFLVTLAALLFLLLAIGSVLMAWTALAKGGRR